jgi:glycosyltransferase involved in cell wall biosynthesis
MQKTIGIFTVKVPGLEPWDPDSIHKGISGSEEAVIYASQELAKLGYKVFVFNEPPQGSKHSLPEANPRFINYFSEQICFDIIIACRAPEFVEYLRHRAKKIYFWPQDVSSHRVKEENIDSFDDVFWISSWQREQWISVNPSFAKFTKIFGNALQLHQFEPPKARINPYSCIYASNYARGLSVLLDVWPQVKMQYPKAILDIYYGWKHWGTMSEWQERNLRYQITDLQRLDVKDHGLVGHEELSRAFSKASFWTYPCIHVETFCITAIKAQLSGAVPVIINGSALSELVRYGFKCTKKEDYNSLILSAMSQAEVITLKDRKSMGEFIVKDFTWGKMVYRWDQIFATRV